jgi:hypothetical protein
MSIMERDFKSSQRLRQCPPAGRAGDGEKWVKQICGRKSWYLGANIGRRMAGSVLRDQWSKRGAGMWGNNQYHYLDFFNPDLSRPETTHPLPLEGCIRP